MSVAELLNNSKIPCVGCAWLCILNLYSMIFAEGLQVCGIFVQKDEYTRSFNARLFCCVFLFARQQTEYGHGLWCFVFFAVCNKVIQP